MSKATIILNGQKKITEFNAPKLISEIIRDLSVEFPMPCGGRGKCGKCGIYASGSLSGESENKSVIFDNKKFEFYYACRTYADGDVEIIINNGSVHCVENLQTYVEKLKPMGENYAIAFDIGTTTLAAEMYNLKDGKLLAEITKLNSQSSYGADIISRIDAAINQKSNELKKCIVDDIKFMTSHLCESCSVNVKCIDAVSISGNTAMMYLLTGKSPKTIAKAPFENDDSFGKFVDSENLSLPFEKKTKIYLSKCIGGFIGGDITNGLIAEGVGDDFENGKKTIILFIDIGTNGETVLFKNGEISCCSTAIGPCFEGACIHNGMTATEGAIDSVKFENNEIKYTTIENKKAVGICGTGIVDAVCGMLEAGIIDRTGRIKETGHNFEDNLEIINDMMSLKIADGVFITQSDIRAVQTAKSSICSGINTLLTNNGVKAEEIETLIISGSFGKYLNFSSAEKIGMFPKNIKCKIRYAGNSSLNGAAKILLNTDNISVADRLASSAKRIELAGDKLFYDEFIDNMLFFRNSD